MVEIQVVIAIKIQFEKMQTKFCNFVLKIFEIPSFHCNNDSAWKMHSNEYKQA